MIYSIHIHNNKVVWAQFRLINNMHRICSEYSKSKFIFLRSFSFIFNSVMHKINIQIKNYNYSLLSLSGRFCSFSHIHTFSFTLAWFLFSLSSRTRKEILFLSIKLIFIKILKMVTDLNISDENTLLIYSKLTVYTSCI